MTHEQEHEHRERNKPGAFKVVDRRRFTATGEVRADAPPDVPRPPSPILQPAPTPQAASPASRPPEPAGHAQAPAASEATDAQPRASASSVDFLSFVSSLATNAMAAMGLLPPSQTRNMPLNLNMAREYIEIIVMLQERTVGNLSTKEDHAMTQLIGDLGRQYVTLQRQQAAAAVQPSA